MLVQSNDRAWMIELIKVYGGYCKSRFLIIQHEFLILLITLIFTIYFMTKLIL